MAVVLNLGTFNDPATHSIPITAGPGDMVVIAVYVDEGFGGGTFTVTTPAGFTNPAGGNTQVASYFDATQRVYLYHRTLDAGITSVSLDTDNVSFLQIAAIAVPNGVDIADLTVLNNLSGSGVRSVSGSATAAGVRVLFGAENRDRTFDDSVGFIVTGSTRVAQGFGVRATGQQGMFVASNEVAASDDIAASWVLDVAAPGEPFTLSVTVETGGIPDPAAFQPDRIASSFFETAGDILARVPQSDVSANEVVPLLEQLNIGDIVDYVTITRPERVIKRFRVSADLPQPGPKRNYRYRTLKGLLGGIYPDSIFGTTQQLLGTATATAQEIVQYVLNQWNARHGLNFGAVPPLYLFIPDANGDYTETLESDVIVVRQPNAASQPLEPRRSMQQLLEAMLSAFPGYKLVITDDDELVIRSPWWSDAYDRTTLTLGEDDVIAPLPRASLDDSEVRNVWSVTSTQYGFVDDQAVIAPSYERLSFVDSGYTPAGREFASFATYRDVNGDPLIVNGPVTVDWTHRIYGTVGQLNFRTGSVVVQPNETTEVVVNMDIDGVGGDKAWINIRHTSTGLSVRIAQAAESVSTPFTGTRLLDHFFEYDASGSAWGETGTEQIRYGEGRDRVIVPGLGTSQSVYGTREGSITTEFFSVGTLQAVRIAQSLTRWFMNPRAKYTDVNLTTRAEVGPEDIWRLASLPDGSATVMESYRYMDARTMDSLMARTSASFEFLFDLEGSVSEPAGSGEDVALGADGSSWYAN